MRLYKHVIWGDIWQLPQERDTSDRSKRKERTKRTDWIDLTNRTTGHWRRAVFAILAMFLMVFECVWGSGTSTYRLVNIGYGLRWFYSYWRLLDVYEQVSRVRIYASSGTDALMPMKVVPYYWVRKGRGRTDGASGEANWPRGGSFRRLVKVALWQ